MVEAMGTEATRTVEVGECVRMDGSGAFDYGGSGPFGGVVVGTSPERGEADVSFYDRHEDGGWGWACWTFPVADLWPVVPAVLTPELVEKVLAVQFARLAGALVAGWPSKRNLNEDEYRDDVIAILGAAGFSESSLGGDPS